MCWDGNSCLQNSPGATCNYSNFQSTVCTGQTTTILVSFISLDKKGIIAIKLLRNTTAGSLENVFNAAWEKEQGRDCNHRGKKQCMRWRRVWESGEEPHRSV